MANEVIIDLSEYRDTVGSHVPAGRYKVVVEETEQASSKAGNPMINLWFRVLDGDSSGSIIVDRLVLSSRSLFRVVGFMQALGLPTPRKRLNVNIGAWVGKVLMIDVEDGEPYNGRVKSEVRGYVKISKSASSSASSLDALAAPEPVTLAADVTSDTLLGGLDSTTFTSQDEGAKEESPVHAMSSIDEVDLDELDL